MSLEVPFKRGDVISCGDALGVIQERLVNEDQYYHIHWVQPKAMWVEESGFIASDIFSPCYDCHLIGHIELPNDDNAPKKHSL
jgi:hypothetical protein